MHQAAEGAGKEEKTRDLAIHMKERPLHKKTPLRHTEKGENHSSWREEARSGEKRSTAYLKAHFSKEKSMIGLSVRRKSLPSSPWGKSDLRESN